MQRKSLQAEGMQQTAVTASVYFEPDTDIL